ncbi:MAG: DUF1330 domain-containing protein [Sphingomonadaceae bacterium]|nr:DUF1330 domain-containing protein [Sphingomonadaceae bacterium]
MPAFIVATVTVSDAAAFGRYVDGIDGLAEQFGGHYVLRGPVTEYLEGGSTPGERVVMLQFDTAERARDFYTCEQYQAAKKHREGAAALTMRLIEA